jgi:hypothetical protein
VVRFWRKFKEVMESRNVEYEGISQRKAFLVTEEEDEGIHQERKCKVPIMGS